MFEQVAFGMFPRAVLAPIALVALALGVVGDDRRLVGRSTLDSAALPWLTGSLFERKVGFTIFAGFPACAIAIGVWLDGFLEARRAADEAPPESATAQRHHGTSMVIGAWALFGVLALAKDLGGFPERLTSL